MRRRVACVCVRERVREGRVGDTPDGMASVTRFLGHPCAPLSLW